MENQTKTQKEIIRNFEAEAEKFIKDNCEFEIKQKKFKDTRTGEIVSQIDILEIEFFEEVE